MLEMEFKLHGKLLKKASLWIDRDKTIVQVLELREEPSTGKSNWYPIILCIHNKFYEARLQFIGIVSEIAYEQGNNTVDTSRENIFIRGSIGKFK